MPKMTIDTGTLDENVAARIVDGITKGLRSLGEAAHNIEVITAKHTHGITEPYANFLCFKIVILDPIKLNGKTERFEHEFNAFNSQPVHVAKAIKDGFLWAARNRHEELLNLARTLELEAQKVLNQK